ncbi:MAG: SUMF1/EgtB/PvdO family nonheme iron enzyme, partial [Candidatus Adiutrix sp.]|nr:SUMF1/EgtB/PvdO family nonheme iron enzyme [Candidatus Adiutrix sp.]
QANYFAKSPSEDPKGPASGNQKVNKGGCYVCKNKYSRISERGHFSRTTKNGWLGFRLAMGLEWDLFVPIGDENID